jgi:hypothetical protein
MTPSPDSDQSDVLALSHAVAELVALLHSDNHRCDARAQRLQVQQPTSCPAPTSL